MNTNANTQGAVIGKTGKSKVTVAPAMTAAQAALYERGEQLGYTAAESHVEWSDALKLCKSPMDRNILRAGFVAAFRSATGKPEKAAQNRFDYLARVHTPETSRKAAKRAKGAGRKEKATGNKGNKVDAPQVAAQRLAKVLHFVAKMQAKHAGDDEMLEVLGDIAAIAGGDK